MLKKLVKYGNSNALVIDRAILELLNIKEGGVLKLETNGKSLIITPQEEAEPSNALFMSEIEKKNTESNAAYHDMMARMEAMPKPEIFAQMVQGLQEVQTKHETESRKLSCEEYDAELNALVKKYPGDVPSAEFLQEFGELQLKFAPGLAQMYQEMTDVMNKSKLV